MTQDKDQSLKCKKHISEWMSTALNRVVDATTYPNESFGDCAESLETWLEQTVV